jgi:hypothetical protein
LGAGARPGAVPQPAKAFLNTFVLETPCMPLFHPISSGGEPNLQAARGSEMQRLKKW